MRMFDIQKGEHKGKHIHVTLYQKTANGVNIQIEHNVPTVAGRSVQWVQTVSSNAGFSVDCKMMTRVDPFGHGNPKIHKVELPAVPGGLCKADDLLPFYWTEDDLKNGAGPDLSDGPNGPFPDKGRIWTNFVTALTEVTGDKVHHLVAITWGYDRMADKTVRENGIFRATMPQMKVHGQALKRMYPDFHYT